MVYLRVRPVSSNHVFPVWGSDGLSLLSSSKTSPIPHAYIRLADPEKQFVQGVGYDVDVELELVRPRRADSEENGKLDEFLFTTTTPVALSKARLTFRRRLPCAAMNMIQRTPSVY